MHRRLGSAALLLLASSVAACGPGEIGEVGEDGSVLLEAAPGELVEIEGLGVIAPVAGDGVWAEIVFEDGSTETLHLETTLVGDVLWFPPALHEHDEEPSGEAEENDGSNTSGETASEASASSSPGPCSDKARSQLPFRWNKSFRWRFRAASTPSGLSKDNVETRLRRAAINITRSDNSCSMADYVSATQSYRGRTSRYAQITAAGHCGSSNGHNTVAFGNLPAGVLGVACTWYSNGVALESDIKLNKADHKWTANGLGPGCTNRYSVEAVATHEFGHVFGLGHVSESNHGNLTMSTAINGPCQNSEATLGRGDVIALRAKY